MILFTLNIISNMKKLYLLTLMALAGTAAVSAQSFRLDHHYVMKTCKHLEGDPEMTRRGNQLYMPGQSDMEDMGPRLEGAPLDETGTTFPFTGPTPTGQNYHILEQDYTDPVTGVSFEKGTYACLNTYGGETAEIFFKSQAFPQGLSNLKQIVLYMASQGALWYYGNCFPAGASEYDHFEGDPSHRKLKEYYAPGFSDPKGEEKGDAYRWHEMHFNAPLKFVVDFTNAPGTYDETTNASVYINKPVNGVYGSATEFHSNLQFYEKATNEKGETVQGENLIPWSDDRGIVFKYKKGKSYLMAILFVCGDEEAGYRYIDLSETAPQWGEMPEAGVKDITITAERKVDAIYNLNGVRLGDYSKGINIVRYSDGSVEKIVR